MCYTVYKYLVILIQLFGKARGLSRLYQEGRMSRRKEREKNEHQDIEQRIEFAEQRLFQRYFFSRILRLLLLLIHEDIWEAPIGLVLPAQGSNAFISPFTPRNLSKVGESLVGWLEKDHSFYTFLDQAPSVEVPNDYRLHRLQMGREDTAKDGTIVVVPRKVKSLSLDRTVVEVMRRCLAPVYEHAQNWDSAFGQEMQGLFDPTAKFSSGRNHSDPILTGFADMIVHLGGQRADSQQRWCFCGILLPQDFMLPLHRRSLVVCAQSKGAPHRVGSTIITPYEQPLSLSLRAFQSGSILYRHEIVNGDSTVSHREVEGPIRSAIAVP